MAHLGRLLNKEIVHIDKKIKSNNTQIKTEMNKIPTLLKTLSSQKSDLDRKEMN